MTNETSPAVESLNQILTDVTANRKNLANQIETQKQQLEIGIAQLAKFDTLVAALQVTLDSPAVLESVAQQEAANAVVSPTDVAPVAPVAFSEATA